MNHAGGHGRVPSLGSRSWSRSRSVTGIAKARWSPRPALATVMLTAAGRHISTHGRAPGHSDGHRHRQSWLLTLMLTLTLLFSPLLPVFPSSLSSLLGLPRALSPLPPTPTATLVPSPPPAPFAFRLSRAPPPSPRKTPRRVVAPSPRRVPARAAPSSPTSVMPGKTRTGRSGRTWAGTSECSPSREARRRRRCGCSTPCCRRRRRVGRGAPRSPARRVSLGFAAQCLGQSVSLLILLFPSGLERLSRPGSGGVWMDRGLFKGLGRARRGGVGRCNPCWNHTSNPHTPTLTLILTLILTPST